MQGIHRNMFDAPDVRLHYVISGQPRGQDDGRTLVLIHGWPQTWWEWRHVIGPLRDDGWLVVATDYRGAGGSSKPEGGYDKQTIATDIKGLLGHLGVSKPITLVCHDLGMQVGFAFAALFPEAAKRLVMMEAPLADTKGMESVATTRFSQSKLWHFHLHGAVTLAFCGFSRKKVVPYWIAQVVGEFIGAAVVYVLYSAVIDHYTAAQHLARSQGGASGGFFTSPGLAVMPARALVNEIIITAILVSGIFAVTDEFNTIAPRANFGAIVVGLIVAVIGASAGYLGGWAINPARDFGPRFFAWLASWDQAALPGNLNYWWVPMVGPTIGGLLGGGAQHLLIRPFDPHEKKKSLESAR
ncbi:alpha/beta fold hydrolase [Rhizobium sp.]|uniref:alpha/beta fold hydrolase n=1 Tax=Rhizobium sp. TaxID=391 RepID=UPI0034C67A8E